VGTRTRREPEARGTEQDRTMEHTEETTRIRETGARKRDGGKEKERLTVREGEKERERERESELSSRQ